MIRCKKGWPELPLNDSALMNGHGPLALLAPGVMADRGRPEPGAAGLTLAPFRGVRFDGAKVGDIGSVTAPPCDLLGPNGAAGLMTDSAFNVARLTLPWPSGAGKTGQDDHRRAAATLAQWRRDHVLIVDDAPSLYIYESSVAGDGGSPPRVLLRGLIGALHLSRLADQIILTHEDVFAERVEDRRKLISATGANLEPMLLYYEGGEMTDGLIANVTARPALVDFCCRNGLRHRLWPLPDQSAHEQIASDMRDRRALIADGHHRYASYRLLQDEFDRATGSPWGYALALLVDSTRYPPDLRAIHRVLPELNLTRAVELASDAFRVTTMPADPHQAVRHLEAAGQSALLLAGAGASYLLTEPDPTLVATVMPAAPAPAVALLHRLLIPHVWNLPADATKVATIHDDAAAALALARHGGTAVVLNRLRVNDVFAAAAAGQHLPPKSTSFRTKPLSGLVMRLLDVG